MLFQYYIDRFIYFPMPLSIWHSYTVIAYSISTLLSFHIEIYWVLFMTSFPHVLTLMIIGGSFF